MISKEEDMMSILQSFVDIAEPQLYKYDNLEEDVEATKWAINRIKELEDTIKNALRFIVNMESTIYSVSGMEELRDILRCNIIDNRYNDIDTTFEDENEKLKAREQKLIDKLEKDIVNITKTMQDGRHNDDYSRCRLKAYRTKTKEILSILKGE